MSQTTQSQPFKPYWKRTESGLSYEDPDSWIFFVVAEVLGQHRTLAVAASRGDSSENLRGYLLAATCQRLITIFSSSANQHEIQAEVALATNFYADHTPERYELPEMDRARPVISERQSETPQDRLQEFPFISTCLHEGIEWHPESGYHQTQYEPLGTVYRDTSLVWGMVVIDITNLSSIRYGIVAFQVAHMTYITSPQAESLQQGFGAFVTAYRQAAGYRLVEDRRPRQALSAREYVTKFESEVLDETIHQRDLAFLDQFSIISESAMQNVWPKQDLVGQDTEPGTSPKLAPNESDSPE